MVKLLFMTRAAEEKKPAKLIRLVRQKNDDESSIRLFSGGDFFFIFLLFKGLMANVKIYILKIVAAAAANKQKTERVLRSEKTCAEIGFF